ncbi:MAG: class I SAM-dependent methyltransferase [Solirubrobacterales bacterium]|nr:class I SAM-dependent methyltransferase [Solirubrobacterales bacterium]
MRVTVLKGERLGGLRAVDVGESDWEHLDACPICHTAAALTDIGTAHGRRAAGVLAACSDCAHVFLRRRPRASWFDAFYASDWDSRNQEGARSGGLSKAPDPRVLDFCAAHLPEAARVLDVGAGFGSQLVPFRDGGHEVAGVERSSHRAHHLRETLRIPCDHGPIEAVTAARPFDLVFAHHVLEHVSDPAATVAHLHGLLDDRGLVYIAVPSLWRELAPQSLHFAPHLSQYTLRSLTRLLCRSGFEIVAAEEGRDLQVLARRSATPGEASSFAESGPHGEPFDASVRAWVIEGFGGLRPGTRTLVWTKANAGEALYEQRVVRGRRSVEAILAGSRGLRRIPVKRIRKRARSALPAWTQTKSLRLLPVRVEDPDAFPLEVHHPRREAPIWVK